MKDIDFLPVQYREAASQRHTRTWRVVVVGVIVALLGVGVMGQSGRQSGVEDELAVVRGQHAEAMAEATRLAKMQQEMKPLVAEAALLTYLRHPWPTTRIVASLVEPLPDSILLRKMQIRSEQVANAPAPPPVQESAPTEVKVPPPPAELDLERFRTQDEASHLVVTLEGTTREIAALHAYVGKLASMEMFSRVQVASVEGVRTPDPPKEAIVTTPAADASGKAAATRFDADGEPIEDAASASEPAPPVIAQPKKTETSNFVLKLEVRPGYGQPGGPTLKKEKPDQLAQSVPEASP